MINFILLTSSLGQPRLLKRYKKFSDDEFKECDVIQQCMTRSEKKMSNFFEHGGQRVVYRKYASFFFIVGADSSENDIAIFEFIDNYMEILRSYLVDFTEINLLMNIDKAYVILEEMVVHGKIVGSTKEQSLYLLHMMCPK